MKGDTFRSSMLLILRLYLAFVFLWHGIPKLLDIAGTMGFFVTLGLPGFVGIVVGIVEVLFGVFMLLGFWFPVTPYILSAVIVGALGLAQIPGAVLRGFGAGIERDILILISLVVLAAFGPGKAALRRS
ncbi:DoxX family protein [Candidatus Pacearchaeota archaeon]|nr:DoxX family protein [Candidatus Pacearchaeota archaeon]